MYPYFIVELGLAWSMDCESYAGGSVATSRASSQGQVKCYEPDWNWYPDPSGWGLNVRATTPPRKKKKNIRVKQPQRDKVRYFIGQSQKIEKVSEWKHLHTICLWILVMYCPCRGQGHLDSD